MASFSPGHGFRSTMMEPWRKSDWFPGSLLEIFSGNADSRRPWTGRQVSHGTFCRFQTACSQAIAIRVTATVDDPNHLHLRCVDWPALEQTGEEHRQGNPLNETVTAEIVSGGAGAGRQVTVHRSTCPHRTTFQPQLSDITQICAAERRDRNGRPPLVLRSSSANSA